MHRPVMLSIIALFGLIQLNQAAAERDRLTIYDVRALPINASATVLEVFNWTDVWALP